MRRWMNVATTVAVSIGLGLGAGACGEADSDVEPQARATELIDAWIRGWNDDDPDAVGSVFTDDGEYTSFGGGSTITTPSRIAAHAGEVGFFVGEVVRVGDVSETTDGTFMTVFEVEFGPDRFRVTGEMELDGDLIERLWWADDRTLIE